MHPYPQKPHQRPSRAVRCRVSRALHNIVHANLTDKRCKREAKVRKTIFIMYFHKISGLLDPLVH